MWINKKYLTASEIKVIEDGRKKFDDWGSSGKFGNPAVKTYDPSGLRSSMTATHSALEAELEKHEPTQLEQPIWTKHIEAMFLDAKAKNIPLIHGTPPLNVKYPKERYEASW